MAHKDSFNDRAKASAEAQKALLARFKQAPKPDDPEVQARQAERLAIAKAREERAAIRQAAKEEEARRKALELAALAAEKARQEQERLLEIQKAKEAEIALEAERKRARDARYAARKARR